MSWISDFGGAISNTFYSFVKDPVGSLTSLPQNAANTLGNVPKFVNTAVPGAIDEVVKGAEHGVSSTLASAGNIVGKTLNNAVDGALSGGSLTTKIVAVGVLGAVIMTAPDIIKASKSGGVASGDSGGDTQSASES